MDSGFATENEYFTLAKLQVGQRSMEQAQFVLDDALQNYPDSAKLLSLCAKVKFDKGFNKSMQPTSFSRG